MHLGQNGVCVSGEALSIEPIIVGQRLGLGASRQSTYSILSVCPHLDAWIEVSWHISLSGGRWWVGGLSVVPRYM